MIRSNWWSVKSASDTRLKPIAIFHQNALSFLLQRNCMFRKVFVIWDVSQQYTTRNLFKNWLWSVLLSALKMWAHYGISVVLLFILSFSWIFSKKLQNNRLAHQLWALAPFLGKSWIHHWNVCTRFSQHFFHWYNLWNVLCHILFPDQATKTFYHDSLGLLLPFVACWLVTSSHGRSWNYISFPAARHWIIVHHRYLHLMSKIGK